MAEFLYQYRASVCWRAIKTERQIMALSWNVGLESFKFIDNATGTTRELATVFYSHSIVTMALSCISSEIKRDIDRKSRFFHTPAFDVHVRGGGPARALPYRLNGVATRRWKRLMITPFWQNTGMTDKPTDGRSDNNVVRAMHSIAR